MVYRLFVLNGRVGEYEAKGDYTTLKSAEKRAEKFTKRNREVKIIPIPTDSLGVGLRIYLPNGEYYGEIVDESPSFWYINRSFKNEDDKAFFVKSDFIEKFESGVFIVKGEC